MKRPSRFLIVLAMIGGLMSRLSANSLAEDADPDTAADLKLLQGSWELLHGNEGKGPPAVRGVKTIEGNTETVRRYNLETGELTHEHSVQFALSKSGSVRVLTFFAVGGSKEAGFSYVYKVDKENLYDIPGMLHGTEFRNYQAKPTLWHWRRVKDLKAESSDDPKDKSDVRRQ